MTTCSLNPGGEKPTLPLPNGKQKLKQRFGDIEGGELWTPSGGPNMEWQIPQVIGIQGIGEGRIGRWEVRYGAIRTKGTPTGSSRMSCSVCSLAGIGKAPSRRL